MRTIAWAVTVGAVLVVTTAARAEWTCTERNRDGAREQYAVGVEAADAERWGDALGRFEAAYESSCSFAALFNVAVTLRAIGRYARAMDALELLFERHGNELDDDTRSRATTLREEAMASLAGVRIEGLDRSIRYDLSWDGRLLADDGSRPIELVVDPGSHALTVEDPDRGVFRWDGELDPGERAAIRVRLRSSPPRRAHEPAEPEDTSLWESPVLWLIVGAVVGGAGVGAYVWYDAGRLQPESDMPVHL